MYGTQKVTQKSLTMAENKRLYKINITYKYWRPKSEKCGRKYKFNKHKMTYLIKTSGVYSGDLF